MSDPSQSHIPMGQGPKITRSNYPLVLNRAVVFRLFQKTVILPPNPVGFRLKALVNIVFDRFKES